MPRTISAIRIHQQVLTPSRSPSEGANPNMLGVHNVPAPEESHQNGLPVLMKGRRITPSGPSHRGNTTPIFTRHLLRKFDTV
ncbi:hypothetical protein PTKIN_Ptkin01aG0099700 [Pterospermum kingtungense]